MDIWHFSSVPYRDYKAPVTKSHLLTRKSRCFGAVYVTTHRSTLQKYCTVIKSITNWIWNRFYHLLFVCLYQLCLPSELQSGSGSNPHLTASQGLLRASMRIKKAPFPLGRHSSVPDHLRLGGGAGAGSQSPPFLQRPNTWGPTSKILIPPLALPFGLWAIAYPSHPHPGLWDSTPNGTVIPPRTPMIYPHRTSR